MADEILNFKVNPYYMSKMRAFFRAKNRYVKGVLTKKDFELLADKYRDVAQVDTLREKQVRRKLLKIWDDFYEEVSKITPITEEVLAKCIASKETKKLIAAARQYADCFFDLIDLNADGQISREEFRLFHRVYNLNDTTADAAFKVLDKGGKGHIEHEEFVEAVVEFFLPEGEKETPEAIIFGPLVK